MSPHDVLRVPPPQLREHFLTALAALRVSHRGTRMFAYKQVVYDVVRLTFPTWNGPELLNLSNWLGEYQAGFVEHPSSAHDEHPDNIRVLQAVWQLITDGIVYPRLREIRDGQPDSIEWLSPPATEGTRITGITGAQEPTRWRGDVTRPCRQLAARLLAKGGNSEMIDSSPVRQMVNCRPIGWHLDVG
jgi:hypothetical protein